MANIISLLYIKFICNFRYIVQWRTVKCRDNSHKSKKELSASTEVNVYFIILFFISLEVRLPSYIRVPVKDANIRVYTQ